SNRSFPEIKCMRWRHLILLTMSALAVWTEGCRPTSPSDSQASNQGDRATLTFNKNVAPILFQRCAPCHRPGQSAPFRLLNYADALKRAKQIAEVTQRRYMPPWLPEPGYGEFLDERRLTDAQIDTIQKWFVCGAPEGEASDLPPLPKFEDGWHL